MAFGYQLFKVLKMGRTTIDLTGQKFGALTAITPYGKDRHGAVIWQCKCECGTMYTVLGNNLRQGKTTRCPKCRSSSRRPAAHYTISIEVHGNHDAGFVTIARDIASDAILTCGGWSGLLFKAGRPWDYPGVKFVLAQLLHADLIPPRSPHVSPGVWADRNHIEFETWHATPTELDDIWRAARIAGATDWADTDLLNMWERTRGRATGYEPIVHGPRST